MDKFEELIYDVGKEIDREAKRMNVATLLFAISMLAVMLGGVVLILLLVKGN